MVVDSRRAPLPHEVVLFSLTSVSHRQNFQDIRYRGALSNHTIRRMVQPGVVMVVYSITIFLFLSSCRLGPVVNS